MSPYESVHVGVNHSGCRSDKKGAAMTAAPFFGILCDYCQLACSGLPSA